MFSLVWTKMVAITRSDVSETMMRSCHGEEKYGLEVEILKYISVFSCFIGLPTILYPIRELFGDSLPVAYLKVVDVEAEGRAANEHQHEGWQERVTQVEPVKVPEF